MQICRETWELVVSGIGIEKFRFKTNIRNLKGKGRVVNRKIAVSQILSLIQKRSNTHHSTDLKSCYVSAIAPTRLNVLFPGMISDDYDCVKKFDN